MNMLLHLAASFAALILIAAAFMYPFNPDEAQKILKRLFLALLGLMVALDLLAQLVDKLGAFGAGILFLFLSVAAYWLRERRMRRPQRPQRPGRAERKPILPGGGSA